MSSVAAWSAPRAAQSSTTTEDESHVASTRSPAWRVASLPISVRLKKIRCSALEYRIDTADIMRSQIIVLCLVLLPTVAAITFSGARLPERWRSPPPAAMPPAAAKRRTWHWSHAAPTRRHHRRAPSRDTADETAAARKSGCRFGSSEEFTLFLRLSKQYLKFKAAARKDRRKCKRAADTCSDECTRTSSAQLPRLPGLVVDAGDPGVHRRDEPALLVRVLTFIKFLCK